MIEAQNYVGGKWSAAKVVEIFSPTDTREKVGSIPDAGISEIEAAVQAAEKSRTEWRRLGYAVRGNVLHQAASKIEANLDMLAEVATKEMGKPIAETRGEAARTAAIFRYYAGEGLHSIGDVIPAVKADTLQFTTRDSLGVVGIVTPWNFPLAIPAWKLAPALVYGNAVVFKPAELSSLSAYVLINLIVDLFPSGVINLVLGKGAVAGEALVQHEGINGISFTGSTEVGHHIAEVAVKRGAKYQLEMGGKNPVIVADDANLSLAVDMVVSGAMRSAGQKCTATSRVIVMDKIRPKFTEALVERVKELRVGDPLDAGNYLGPVVSKVQKDKVNDLISTGTKDGARLLVGGSRDSDIFQNGHFVAPTVFDQVPINATISQEEIFGPVVGIIEARGVEDAIALANNVRYGLSASIFTDSLDAAMVFVEGVQAGMVRVNEETAGVELQAPFGGLKASSSHSREQGRSAIDFYTHTKTVAIRPPRT